MKIYEVFLIGLVLFIVCSVIFMKEACAIRSTTYGNTTYYYDDYGNDIGRTSSYGNTTYVYDSYGNTEGRATTYGNSTYYYEY